MARRPSKSDRVGWEWELDLGKLGKIKKTVTPEDIRAMKEAGMSPEDIRAELGMSEEIKATLTALSSGAATLTPPVPPPLDAPAVKQGPTVKKLIESFNAERVATNGKGWKIPPGDDTKLRRLVELVGDIDCSQLGRETARNIRNKLARLPANTANFRGQSINEILKLDHQDTLSAKSVRDHIDLYSRLFKWARNEGLHKGGNPFEGLAPRDPVARNEKRLPFTDADLTAIFSSQTFTAIDLTKERPHRYWAPLIALHTGARNAEIGALEATDIKQLTTEGGAVWVFDINTDADKKRVKTNNAIRQIPVHNRLIQLGLLDYCKAVQAQGHTRLFPYLSWDERDGYGRYIGEHFNALLKELDIYVKRKKVFYSFRHTLATALERARVPIQRIEQISGRSIQGRTTVGQQFYISPAEAIHLYEDLMKVDFSAHLTSVKPLFDMVASDQLWRLFK